MVKLQDEIEIEGIRFSGPALVNVIQMITNPRVGMWYSFRRENDQIIVTSKQEEPK